MKITHICTSPYGGAGVAAYGLHRALLETGVDSYFLHCNKPLREENELIIQNSPPTLLDNLLYRIGFPKLSRQKQIITLKKIKANPSLFSFPQTDLKNLHNNELVQQSDIINLHWISGIVDYPTFFPNINKPIVWTLHDMNPFKGGFHYQNDEDEFISHFTTLNKKVLRVKKTAISKVKNLTVVTPSKWLAEESMKSSILSNRPHFVVPYSTSTRDFRPLDKSYCRNIFGIPQDKKVLAFVAGNVLDKRKGFDLLNDAVNGLDYDICLLAIGGNNKSLPSNNKTIPLGTISDKRLMAIAYNCADAVVVPSREDNLPNVLLESLCCGVPVIGFSIGGIKDVIENGENGIDCGFPDKKNLENGIIKFIHSSFNNTNIAKSAHDKFKPSSQANKYLEIYLNTLAKSHQ